MDSATKLLSKQKFYAFCGILGPILFAILVTILGLLRQDYSHARDFISDLGTPGTQYALMMNMLVFPVVGILLIAFTIGLYQVLKDERNLKLSAILLAIYGVGYIGIAFFPFNKDLISYSNLMHNIFGLLSDVSIIIAIFLLAGIFKNNPRWENFWLFTVISGTLITVIFILYFLVPTEQYLGVIQRAYIGLQLLWIEIIALKLFFSSQPTADSFR